MTVHIPVLLQETINNLNVPRGGTFLDGTLGSGGHSAALAKQVSGQITIIGLDQDEEALERSRDMLFGLSDKVFLRQVNFRLLDEVLEGLGIQSVDAILLDLGLSSNQLEESGRGFSFQKDEPLLMTMIRQPGENDLTAEKILNTFSEEALELILRGFGEERYSKKIAREIVERREKKSFKTTSDLLEAVRAATPASYHRGKINPATRTFQAIRIAVNEELTALEEGLEKGFKILKPRGRFAVISFHSLEDRIVKNFFRDKAQKGLGKLITKKPIVPTEEEKQRNPRSRSAKLRVIEKIK